MHKCETTKEERESLGEKITVILFMPLILISYLFYSESGKSFTVFFLEIVALLLYVAMYINRYYLMNSFPEDSPQREKHFKVHQILRVCLFAAGIALMFMLISVFENMRKL